MIKPTIKELKEKAKQCYILQWTKESHVLQYVQHPKKAIEWVNGKGIVWTW